MISAHKERLQPRREFLKEACVRGQVYLLTLMGANILRYTATRRQAGQPKGAGAGWGLREDTDTRAIDNFIVRLRRYIEGDPSKPDDDVQATPHAGRSRRASILRSTRPSLVGQAMCRGPSLTPSSTTPQH
jgi:hypothetical protein